MIELPTAFTKTLELYKSWHKQEQKSFKKDLWRFFLINSQIVCPFNPTKWSEMVKQVSLASEIPPFQVISQLFSKMRELKIFSPSVIERWECRLKDQF